MSFFETFKKNMTIEHLQKEADSMIIRASDRQYLLVYPEFIAYFQNIQKPLTKHDIIIGISFTYSWMPTILKNISGIDENIIRILNDAKKGKNLGKNDLEALKKCFNNSLVGSSKLLHFVNPEVYAIWDSRVFRYLTKKEPYNQVENADAYISYLSFCNFIINNPKFTILHDTIESKAGNKLTKMRAIELLFFHNGTKKIDSRSEINEMTGDDGMTDIWDEPQELQDYSLYHACTTFINTGMSREKALALYKIDEQQFKSLHERFHTWG